MTVKSVELSVSTCNGPDHSSQWKENEGKKYTRKFISVKSSVLSKWQNWDCLCKITYPLCIGNIWSQASLPERFLPQSVLRRMADFQYLFLSSLSLWLYALFTATTQRAQWNRTDFPSDFTFALLPQHPGFLQLLILFFERPSAFQYFNLPTQLKHRVYCHKLSKMPSGVGAQLRNRGVNLLAYLAFQRSY